MAKRIFYTYFVFLFVVLAASAALADTVYFKNGRSVEGIVRAENDNMVEIEIGSGTIACNRLQVEKIIKSSQEEENNLRDKWGRRKEDLEAKADEFSREREKRFSEYGAWVKEEREKQAVGAKSSKEVSVRRDLDSRSILVDAMLNDKVSATLVLDTGASVVVLTKKIGEKLGLDMSDSKKDMITLTLAGNRKVGARMVVLKSLKVKDIEVKDVLTAVLLEDAADSGFKDGLLGMTFLNQFNLKMDLKDMKLSLKKINK